jgi:hypothetical protein
MLMGCWLCCLGGWSRSGSHGAVSHRVPGIEYIELPPRGPTRKEEVIMVEQEHKPQVEVSHASRSRSRQAPKHLHLLISELVQIT